MEKEMMIEGQDCYTRAEERALNYFQLLKEQVDTQSYSLILQQDINEWKKQYVQPSIISRFTKIKTKSTQYYQQYIHWLHRNGKLDQYLDRSVSYIFLRDLGKSLESPKTKKRIHEIVQQLKNDLTSSKKTVENEWFGHFNKASLYQKAQKEGLELTVIWLFEKLNTIAAKLPKEMDPVNAQRKLIKTIGGVVMHCREELGEELDESKRTEKLDEAIRLGYAYGLTYPFIDDILDSTILTPDEKQHYSEIIRTTLTTGNVPPFENWIGPNESLIRFIHTELSEAFEYIKYHQPSNKWTEFLEQAFIFYESQEVDRRKDLNKVNYTNEELYVPVILKSAYSRLIARLIINSEEDDGFDNRIFFYGIYNQLADDFSDMLDDLANGAVTPYTYYLTYYKERNDLMNPFEMYWSVITKLIHHVYHSNPKVRDIILKRAINGLRRFKEKVGDEKYTALMDVFTNDLPQLKKILQLVIKKADDVDFYDKLLRDQMLLQLKTERTEKEQFKMNVQYVQEKLNKALHISEEEVFDKSIVDCANYSLESGGKRLRPLLTWLIGVKTFNMEEDSIFPLLRSLEYMHTASLIFDDLPSQDNAEIRRGKPTLHVIHNEATAQLTGLFLTQKAYEEQTTLQNYSPEAVLKLIRYSSEVTAKMCEGQAMDLASKGKLLTIEELNDMCFYKTGLGFEASLVMPAILAQIPSAEIEVLKKFSKHAGIAFQIKDDLLDVEGEFKLLGKPIGADEKNKNSTFVSVLGKDEAQKMMWEHYCIAMETLETIAYNVAPLKHFLDYIVHRNK